MTMMKYFVITGFFLFQSCATISPENCNARINDIQKVIINVATDSMVAVEIDIHGNFQDSFRQIVFENAVTELRRRFKYDKVIEQSNRCTDNALLVTGKVMILEHHHSRYRSEMHAQITDCKTGSIILFKELSARNHDYLDTPAEIGRNLGELAYDALRSCR